MDANLSLHETVWAAAGADNAVFPTSPAVLRSLSNAAVAPVVVEVVELPRGGESRPRA
jgi:prolyl-tRNA editing enzyme YbaK/EbsC (Cys-tRNA(Pro) deacylase)